MKKTFSYCYLFLAFAGLSIFITTIILGFIHSDQVTEWEGGSKLWYGIFSKSELNLGIVLIVSIILFLFGSLLMFLCQRKEDNH